MRATPTVPGVEATSGARRRSHVAGLVALTALLSGSMPHTLAAQAGTSAGVLLGSVESRQLRPRDAGSESRSDLLVGAWADVTTPLGWLGVLAEAVFARRGGEYRATGPAGLDRSVRVDYLSAAIVPRARLELGPLAPYAGLGFALESELGTRAPAELARELEQPATQVFALVALAGLEARVGARWSLRAEVRHSEQLSAAFRPPGGDVRHRSREIALKVGVRLGR